MTNRLIDSLKREYNIKLTENGATTHKSTLNAVYDLFALGGAYRSRTKEDKMFLFKKAFEENKVLALKCLFYLRDILEGQGERQMFRDCYSWLAKEYPEIAKQNINLISEYGRWDDIFCLIDTPIEQDIYTLIKEEISKNRISLIYKWLPSENTSSKATRELARKTRKALNMTAKEYRKMLSKGRKESKVLEVTMSNNNWDDIDFSKIPSLAGLRYRKCFANRAETAERYAEFMNNKGTKVNAQTLTPYDIVDKVLHSYELDKVEQASLDKYWNNQKDWYGGKTANDLAIVDVSGSMYPNAINAAIGMGMYIAERCGGAFKDYFMTFSERPILEKVEGLNICDKISRMSNADWGYNTNIERVFDLLLDKAIYEHLSQDELPNTIYIFSDMEFDSGLGLYIHMKEPNTLMESIAEKWRVKGYELPRLIFWNLDARNDNIPMLKGAKFGYISGFSMSMVETVLSGKDGLDLMLEKLNSDRYKKIRVD